MKRLAVVLADGSRRRNLILRFSLVLSLVFVITLMFPHGESIEYSYTVGAVWPDRDLVAPFSFPILRDARTYEKERQEAARAVYPVFGRDEKTEKTQVESLATVMRTILAHLEQPSKQLKGTSKSDSVFRATAKNLLPYAINENQWQILARLKANDSRSSQMNFIKFEKLLSSSLVEALRVGILNQHRIRPLQGAIALREGSTETIIPPDKIYDYDSAIGALERKFAGVVSSADVVELAVQFVREVIRPNVLFDKAETDLAVKAAEDNVPRTSGFVRERETIISKNEVITAEAQVKLESLQKARQDRGIETQGWRHWLGITLHVLLVLALFSIYLFLFRKKIFHDNAKITIVALIILMEMFFTFLSIRLPIAEPTQFLILVPAGSMLLAIIFDSRVAFYGTVTIAFLVAAMRGNDYSFALISLIGGSLGAYTVRDIRHRTQIFRSLVFIFLGYALSILALSIERFESGTSVLYNLTFALANAVFSPVLTYGLLIVFERMFNVTTDLTLVELADFNHPLLQDLSEKAPGTFHHSVTIGSLAETAAEAIGANAILAKVGGYYHDVGKLLKAEYFGENQVIGHNKHNRLRPRMSALIIASHVKEGIELARQYGLPDQIIDFIPQHHGTNRISFFYDKALRQATKRPTKETINEEDFRYPGPKPQSKETGIVMLADSVEASTRAIEEMTTQSLERAIDNMIKHRFLEGQLEDCELTLRDLTNIKEAFLKILIGIHHQRIKYPEKEIVEKTPFQVQKLEDAPPVAPEAPPALVTAPAIDAVSVTPASPPQNDSGAEDRIAGPSEPTQSHTGDSA